jgi:hypothetical protein
MMKMNGAHFGPPKSQFQRGVAFRKWQKKARPPSLVGVGHTRQFLVYQNAVLGGDCKSDGVREGCDLVPPEFVIRVLSFLWTNGYDLCIIFDGDEWGPFRTSSIAVLNGGWRSESGRKRRDNQAWSESVTCASFWSTETQF